MKDKWIELENGAVYYGAPAHGGALKVTTLEGSEDGQNVQYAQFEIAHVEVLTWINQICIPAGKLRPLIDYLLKVWAMNTGTIDDMDRRALLEADRNAQEARANCLSKREEKHQARIAELEAQVAEFKEKAWMYDQLCK